ncbi:MAG: short-chain dehydrogenase, partial [Acidobacteria bacterium]|nr:short-chain dehydrogenase [Acidobacteriota bacterium]
EGRGLLNLAIRAARPFFLTAEQGTAGLIKLASSPTLEGVSGKYFAKGREARSSRASYDTAAARRLWEMSVSLTRATA